MDVQETKEILWVLHNENIYGHQKRLRFILDAINDFAKESGKDKKDIRILDVGCGTGVMITIPLASKGFNVVGVDTDAGSIAFAESINPYKDARFICGEISKINFTRKFDVIICSEVLEHLGDPEGFLRDICRLLVLDGILIITVPNGYGWFEFEELLWKGLKLGYIFEFLMPWILKLKNAFSYYESHLPSTLDSSVHIQRFTKDSILRVIERCSLRVIRFSGSGLIGGRISDLFLSGIKPIMMLNNRLGDIFPQIASGYYIICRPIVP